MNMHQVIEETLVPHTAFVNALDRVNQCYQYAHLSPEPTCVAVIGESRTGKSRVLEEVSGARPKRRTPEGLLVPSLYLKLPSNPTVKNVVTHLLNYMEDPRYDSGTEYARSIRLGKLMRNAGTRVVILDEFQHFYDKRLNTVSEVTDWLKIFVEEAKVSLIIGGLPSCKAIINQNEQLSGRFLQPIVMPRFSWVDMDSRAEFLGIVDAFGDSLRRYFKTPEMASEEMGFRFFCATGGLIGYLTKMLRQAVWDASSAACSTITLENFAEAHKKALWNESTLPNGVSPFSREFLLTPSKDILNAVGTVGIPTEAPTKRPSRRSNVAAVAPALSARGNANFVMGG